MSGATAGGNLIDIQTEFIYSGGMESDVAPEGTSEHSAAPVDAESDDNAETSEPTTGYQRSTVRFPYGALQDAESVAVELHAKWGGRADLDQLAAGMNTNPSSGTFRMKVATASTFGVIHVRRGNTSLTALGQKLVDPQTQAAARVEAFMTVPLFARPSRLQRPVGPSSGRPISPDSSSMGEIA
jgi:hypothetical protein